LSTPDTDSLALPSDAGPPNDAAGAKPSARQFVTFNVADEMFAVPMGPVQEIIRVPAVARMPLAPAALDGLSNLRGRVLPIVNLRRLFGTTERDHDDATRALVINLGQPLGFVVDRVASVISVEAGEIEPATAIQSIVQADFLTGVINRNGADGTRQLILMLDFEALVRGRLSSVRLDNGAQGGSGGRGEHASIDSGAPTHWDAVVDELRLVSFTVDDQEYAIAIADVQEIVQVPASITAVPKAPHHVLGLISLRQRLLPLVSLRCLFGLAPVEPTEHHRIVVVALPDGGQVGLVTDTVNEVLSVPRSLADAMPGVLQRDEQLREFESICRLEDGKRLVSILNTDTLLGLPAIRDAVQAAASHSAGAARDPDDASHDAHAEDPTMSRTANSGEAATDDDAQVVIFRLGAEEFGVPIMSVQEIVRVPEVLTRVPRTPRFVEGVINLRGTVLPVIDQRARLGMETIARNDRQRIMVYLLGGLRTGFIVDSVAEVLRINRSHIEQAPDLSDEAGRLITQVAKLDSDRRLVMLIDPSQLLGAREVSAMAAMDATGSKAVKPSTKPGVADLPPLAQAA
jgi:purine-binding chemotaxis protein CheW